MFEDIDKKCCWTCGSPKPLYKLEGAVFCSPSCRNIWRFNHILYRTPLPILSPSVKLLTVALFMLMLSPLILFFIIEALVTLKITTLLFIMMVTVPVCIFGLLVKYKNLLK